MHSFAVLLTVVTLLAAAASAQSSTYFWWHAAIVGADSLAAATHPTFVLHGRQESLDVAWAFKNDEGAENIQLEPATFRDLIRVRATDGAGRAVDTVLAWSATGTLVTADSHTTVGAFLQHHLQPGDRMEWQASLHRADGSAWARGEYRLTIDMSAAFTTLRTAGKPFAGRAEPSGALTVRILPGNTATAAKAKHLREGHNAVAEGRLTSAVASYRAAASIDPSDRAVRGMLGQVLVAAGQYKEGAAALEVALPLALTGEKSAIPDMLAYAYLALGDELNARRVLLLTGTESALSARLERLRKKLPSR